MITSLKNIEEAISDLRQIQHNFWMKCTTRKSNSGEKINITVKSKDLSLCSES